LDIYEDIFSPTMSGSLMLGDSGDIISNLKLHGNEFLVVSVDNDALYLIQGNYGVSGRVAHSLVSVKAKRPAYYSLARLLLAPPVPP